MRLTALDGMRGVAALMVSAYHISGFFSAGSPLVPNGGLAVDFFFLLSGFVLALAYTHQLDRGMTLGQFMLRRVIRLAPLFWVGSLIGAVWVVATTGFSLHQIVLKFAPGFLFLPVWPTTGIEALFPINPPGWSLFFELFIANLLFAAAFARRHALAIALAAVPWLVWSAVHYGYIGAGFNADNVWGGFPRVLFSFFAGVALFQYRDRLPTCRVPALALLAILIATFMTPLTGALLVGYDVVCVLLVYPAIVHLGASASEVSPQTGRHLGEISYPLYAIHYPLGLALSEILKAAGVAWLPLYTLGLVALLAAVSWALVRAVDRPIQRAFARRWAKAEKWSG